MKLVDNFLCSNSARHHRVVETYHSDVRMRFDVPICVLASLFVRLVPDTL